jgi:hypothetical protein
MQKWGEFGTNEVILSKYVLIPHLMHNIHNCQSTAYTLYSIGMQEFQICNKVGVYT